ncbi:hypothetical protein [Flavobacterium sp. Root186]|uniref:hypothetical protein n=1 Tax=Flavobacterium sp. Root186 TaxID=1736485 RepID=UPI0006FB115C|nr:hypothetical protein [Flavobacterium sp. Root186]KRB58038.1 hypothetical protein ASD98_07180 [Flavobacterium sp. Root186]
MSTQPKQFNIHEDWTVVILGFIIIGISLFIFLPEVPVFSWSDTSDLFTKVFDFANLKILLIQFLYLISIGTIGTFLIGRSVKYFLFTFPIVYLLTLIIAFLLFGS